MSLPWSHSGEVVKYPPEGAVAFVYYLEFEDGSKYIGKKNLVSTSRKKVVGRKNRIVLRKESNWRTYMSSSDVVKEKLKVGDKLIKREILLWCFSLTEATYWETKLLFQNDVLCNEEYLNKNISCKIMRCHKKDIDGSN